MVYNPALSQQKQPRHVQQKFGVGANLSSPYPSEELFIEDKRDWSTLSHLEMKRAYPDTQPLLVIDSRTPDDGAIWYIDSIADASEVSDGEAENTNTLFKMRMSIEDVVILYTNYDIAKISIRENMDQVGIPYPTPENFDQEKVFKTGFKHIKDRYSCPTWVIATPDELEESTDSDVLDKWSPPQDIAYRVKSEVTSRHGLMFQWTLGSEAERLVRPGGIVLEFPQGSKCVQLDYDPDMVVPRYQRPEGSL